MSPPELKRERGDDVEVTLRIRRSAFEALTSEHGAPMEGFLSLVEEDDGAYAICVWTLEMPELPDPVPGSRSARLELAERDRA